MRRLTCQELRTRWRELQNLALEWDPIGVADIPECRDEYDECVVGPLLRMLEQGATAEQVSAFLQTELPNHFGIEPKPSRDDALVAKAWAWFNNHWRDTMAYY